MNILFVCTGNTCRSPMAEGIFNAKKLSNHQARSAGIAAINGSPASVYANQLCEQVEKWNHQARQLTEKDVQWADLILTMTNAHKRMIEQMYGTVSVFTLKEFVGYADVDLLDPYGQEKQVYAQTFKEIEGAVDTLITMIR